MSSRWDEKDAAIIRDMIFKEDEFVNHRLTWLVTVQGLLFAALGFAWGKGTALTGLLGAIGIVVSITSFVCLLVSQQAIHGLVKKWDLRKKDDYVGPDIIGFRSSAIVGLLLPWIILPLLFVVAWIFVLAMPAEY